MTRVRKWRQEKNKPPTPIPKVELATLLPQNKRHLGIITTNDEYLTNEMIMPKLKNKIKDSQKTNIKSINLIEIKNAYAKIQYKFQSVYKCNTTVTYTLDTKQDLATVITTTDLGIIDDQIYFNGWGPQDNQLVIDEIKSLLQLKNISEIEMEITNITTRSATVKSKNNSSKYKGEVKFNFTLYGTN